MDPLQFWTIPPKPPQDTDCFIVLSYAVENAHTPTVPTQALIDLACKWRKKFPKAYVIMSTGDNQNLGVPNSRVMKEYGIGVGIPAKFILEEDASRNTYGNLINSGKIAVKRNLKHLTLVTYDLHTRRAVAVARKLGWRNFDWISVGSKGSPAFGIKAFQTYSRLTIFLYEVLAYFYNLMRGQI
jgi:uncharacterized SAM-binding protein YcdF (DUF218 family)